MITKTPVEHNPPSPFWAKILSGSVGSTVTALAVTPLEVVKVRQQSQPSSSPALPSNVSLCPRGCGTFVLNNGLSECLLPKSAVPYFDPSTGRLKETPQISKSRGTFGTLRRIFITEGFTGIYAGLVPTLVMGVPNTVLYFITYEELETRLRQASDHSWIPAFAGASARFVASVSTAPLELIRTLQASRVGSARPALGMVAEFQSLIRAEGVSSLYKGLSPTLFRDVPFSAVYWFCIEKLRESWRRSQHNEEISAWQQAGQALFNGSTSGMIAAVCTTPLDVVKTRRQIGSQVVPLELPICDHQGAVAYNPRTEKPRPTGTFQMMRKIVEHEGVTGLWRGNNARMMKVAPACAIMLSSYEVGKRLLTQEPI
jgi:solute carrier family 25 protein 39/40